MRFSCLSLWSSKDDLQTSVTSAGRRPKFLKLSPKKPSEEKNKSWSWEEAKQLSKVLATREQGPESEPQDSGEKPEVVTHACDHRVAEGRGRGIPGPLRLAKSIISGFHERPCLKE